MSVHIEQVSEVTAELVEAFERLIPQLSRSNPPPTADELVQIVASPATVLFVARNGGESGEIVGTLTLALFRIPTALRAWIEDVVVDEAATGHGIAQALNRAALDHARQAGARTVDLTSRPSREAANHIYKKLGFELRDTNVYRLDFDR